MTLTERLANRMTRGTIYKLRCDLAAAQTEADMWKARAQASNRVLEMTEQHLRSAEATLIEHVRDGGVVQSLRAGLDAIIRQVTPSANATVKRMAKIAHETLHPAGQSDADRT